MLIFAGLPLVSHADEHVTMDFIDRLLPPRRAIAGSASMHGVCAAIMFFLTWQVWIKADTHRRPTATPPTCCASSIGPFVYFMALMIALTGVVHVYKIFVAKPAPRGPQVTA